MYRGLHLAVGPTDQEVEMNFFFEHIGYFAALLPVAFGLCWWIATRGTKTKVVEQGLDKRWYLPLICSMSDTNDKDRKWGVK